MFLTKDSKSPYYQLVYFVNGKRTLTLTSAAKVAQALGLDLRPIKKGR